MVDRSTSGSPMGLWWIVPLLVPPPGSMVDCSTSGSSLHSPPHGGSFHFWIPPGSMVDCSSSGSPPGLWWILPLLVPPTLIHDGMFHFWLRGACHGLTQATCLQLQTMHLQSRNWEDLQEKGWQVCLGSRFQPGIFLYSGLQAIFYPEAFYGRRKLKTPHLYSPAILC